MQEAIPKFPLPSGGDKGEGVQQDIGKKPPYSQELSETIARLRQNPTPAEKKFWHALKENSVVLGHKFRRQHPIGPYITDFYCHSLKCVIEIDGMSHDAKVASDMQRDAYMRSNGLRVFRFTEKDALENPENIIRSIMAEFISASPPQTPPGGRGF